MKLLVLAAFIAVVSSGPLSEQQSGDQQQWPWLNGKQYRYEVHTHTMAHFHEGPSSGNAFKAQFIVRVKAPGQLQAKLENPQHTQFHQQLLNKMELPTDLTYKPVENLDKPIEIAIEGGRVLSLSLPSTLSVSNENLLKGLLSALQLDLSTYHHVNRSQDTYDKESQQGLFSKFETDVTGDCETLYSVSPVNAEWRRELPQFVSEEDPMEVTKSRNYGHCHHRVAYHFGVPKDAEWTGTAHRNTEKQFISHGAITRILVGKQGPIYKAETTSSVNVHPHIYGRQKAEVHSYVRLQLQSIEEDNGTEWQKPEGTRHVKSLLYSLTTKQVDTRDKSSSSSESSEESQRYLDNPQTNAPWQSHENHYSRESSSSSDSSMTSVNDDLPKINEPAYAALYLHTQSRGDKKQNPMNAQKLLLDIAQQLQNPSNMPKGEFLTKFNILVRLISAMSTDQLAQVSRSIEVGKASNNIIKADMWMIFRDAVVQAGTSPAFQQIKTWIKTKKIQNAEAADVISSLTKTLRYPTKDIMKQFFEFALTPEVQEQKFLNTSALIAATKFIRMGHVDYEMAYSYYPTQMYGRFTPKHDRFVVDEILPRLSELLKQAVENEEYSKAQVIIKAIGTLGHREILHVFAPYLEGQKQVTTYLRAQMVFELKPLAVQEDKYVRAVLYSILRNTAEPYEVRVAAILNIFRTNPTTDMMHVMAQMTNEDPSIRVRAALKTGIETAANLKDHRHWHLARSAQAVVNMVTPQDLGYTYSAVVFFDDYEENEDVSHFHATTTIGSEDSLIPMLQRLTWSNRFYGRGAENTLGFSVSSVQDLIGYIKQMIMEPRKSATEQKYSADQISEMLNIKRDPRQPIESSFYFKLYDQERYFALDEADINQLVNDVRELMKQMESGIENHYTKVFYSKQVSVMFPIATGMPFIYKYKEPVVVHLQSKSTGKITHGQLNKDMSATMEHEIQLTLARNIDGSVGFIDTFSNQLASAGVVKKYQINIPVKLNVEGKFGEYKIKLENIYPDQDITLAHYSVWPYSALQKKDTLTPISQDPTTKLIERPKKVASMDVKFGQQAGTVFQLQGYSYSKSYSHIGNLLQGTNVFADLLSPSDLAQTYFALRYLGKQSNTKAVTITAVFDEFHNQKQTGEFGQTNKFTDATANSAARREEIVKRVSSGINTARAQVVDLSASFDGPQKQEYMLTAAYAESPVDPKIQAEVFLGSGSTQHGIEQINAVFKLQTPEISPLNYHEALKKDIKFTYEADINYGENSNINIKGHTERTQRYTEQLKNSPMAKQCEDEIANQNQFQPACHNLLVEGQTPDHFKVSVTYKNVPSTHKGWTSQAYTYIQGEISGNIEYNPSNKVPDGQIELEADAYYSDQSMRIGLTSCYGEVIFDNIPIPGFSPYLLSAYRPFGITDSYNHVANYVLNHQYRPYCTVDGTEVKTFSDRVYEYQLSKSWHVVMQEQESKTEGKWDELVILARRPAEKELEIYISHKSETGKDLEIEIPPTACKNRANVNVKTNGKKVSEGDLTIYWDDVADEPLLQYYNHPEGVLLLTMRDGLLDVIFDGERLILETTEFRNSSRGICGQNSGEPRVDYLTPFGLVDQPEYYGASFALDGEHSDSQTQEWKKQAQQKAYQPKTKYTVILRSDEEWKTAVEQKTQEWGSQKIYRVRNYQKERGQCQLQNQVQYHENHGEICITTTPLPSCQSHCRGSNYQIQAVQAICRSKADQKFRMYKNQIHQGQNPQVTGVPKVEQYRVPTTCTA